MRDESENTGKTASVMATDGYSSEQTTSAEQRVMPEHLARRVEQLSPARRALLELKLKKKAPSGAAESPIPRRQQQTAPLSFNQESLWFLDQLNPHSSLYNLYEAARLRGPLNVAALHRALNAIVARHESLRTTFVNADGEPQQVIAREFQPEWQQIDLPFVAADERNAAALKLLNAEAERPFDLTTGPLIRVILIRLEADEHLLLIVLHHIISDGWSTGVLWQELSQLYHGFVSGREAQLPELPVQFADYAVWLRQQLQGETFSRQLDYWKQQLAGAPALLELPTDRPRPAVQTFRGAQQMVMLPPALSREVKAFSQREGVTSFMTLLAAFKALLVRYTGQDDVVAGSPVAGRTRTETENLIGFFVNTLVLRTDLSGDPAFREALQRVRETTLGAFASQDVPFDRLVAELQPQRSLSYNPLFQTAFALQPETGSGAKLHGLEVTPLKLGSVTAKFDLLLSLTETPDGLRATAEYNTDLFDATTIGRLLRHYQNLLAGAIADPAQRISELPLMSADEWQQVAGEWNDTQTAYPRDASIHQLFEAQAARTPAAIAIQTAELTLSYESLNRRSNQLAHHLRTAGIGPGTVVGLLTERSLLNVIGMLGILKAGGAYLPLDLNCPQARLELMIEDAQAPVVLTQQRLKDRLSNLQSRLHLVCLDADWETIGNESPDNPASLTQADDPAYVIYTSGSTGQPKGVVVPHRAVNRLVCNTDYVQLEATDCVAQVSNVSFDAATFEIWGALLHGARLALITRDVALSPAEFAAQLSEYGVTTLFLTTALFNLLAREVPTAFSSLRHVLFGGEAVDPQPVREVLQHGPPQRLLHVYGPTESTTFASWHLIREVPPDAVTIPIGRPIANTQMYVLDRYRQPVPPGVCGELFIGGDGLARGYLNQPELTAQKFILWKSEVGSRKSEAEKQMADDGWQMTGDAETAASLPAVYRLPTTDYRLPSSDSRLYRTGDLVRYLPDGSIEFIGRTDHQVKLRGFRVECGEIEAALLLHPAIQECVVIVRQDEGRGKWLAAYFVALPESAPAISELRNHLAQRLPDYMIPTAFVPMTALPLNLNGKVDRGRLPAPVETRHATTDAEPKDELELKLKWIWEKVLGLPFIGVNDNFFELGGHSLVAVRLFTEISRTFDRKLPLATLFQAPTIARLAAMMRQQGWQPSWSSLVPLRAGGRKPPFFCVHAVGGNVLEYHDLARHLPPDQPFYGLQSVGLDGKQPPLRTIEEMAAHYLAEVRELQPQGPYYLGGRSFGGSVAFEMARQLQAQGERVAVLAMLDTYPLNWLRLFSRNEARQLKRRFQRQSLRAHLSNLRSLPLRDGIGYVLGKARYKKRKYTHWLWRAGQSWRSAAESSLAATLRDIEEYNYLASKNYLPQVYPGRVTFFCAEQEVSAAENITGWQKLAAGGVEVITVPGDHQTMIKEPDVQHLAQRLQACLDRTQRENQHDTAQESATANNFVNP
ncbi:MAG: amino acid adenylation domain-containing protein [Blastocatellia bacterium]